MANSELTLAQSTLFLVSFWKPIIPLLIIGAWAWVIASVYDKHCARFIKAPTTRQGWNLVHLTLGLLAIASFYAIPAGPWTVLAGIGSMLFFLSISLVSYAMWANRDDRVPEDFRIRLSIVTKMIKARSDKKETKKLGEVKLAIRGPDKQLVAAPPADSPDYAIRTAAEELVIKAQASRSSQVEVLPAGKDGSYASRYLVDGVASSGDTYAQPQGVAIIDFWKKAAKQDVADRRRRQMTDLVIERGAVKTKLRVTSSGVQGGMKLHVLFDADAAVKRKPEDLGLLPEQAEELKRIIETKGVVLLAGLPDGGRTTLLYTISAMHDAYTNSIQVLELEQQMQIEGVTHKVFDQQADGADFGTVARSLLRRDPDVLAVAEMVDANTAKELSKLDGDRTRAYLGIQADSGLAAVEAYTKAIGDNAQASKHLSGVIAIRLMRRLCDNCKVGYAPSPDMLKKMGVGDAKVAQLFKKGGQVLIKNKPDTCPKCGGGGYFGQEGVLEVYSFGAEERDLIAAGNLAGLKAALRKRSLPALQAAAIRKAVDGKTSVEEVTRAIATAPPPAAPAGSAAAKPAAAPSKPTPAAPTTPSKPA